MHLSDASKSDALAGHAIGHLPLATSCQMEFDFDAAGETVKLHGVTDRTSDALEGAQDLLEV